MRKYRNPQLLATLVIFSFIASFSAHVYAQQMSSSLMVKLKPSIANNRT